MKKRTLTALADPISAAKSEGSGRKRVKPTDYYARNRRAVRQVEEYTRANIGASAPRECLSAAEVQNLCQAPELLPVSESTKRDVLLRGRYRLEQAGKQRVTCAVCDRACLIQAVRKCSPTGPGAKKWKEKLCGDDEVPRSLRRFYDISANFPQLHGALLSKRGVVKTNSWDETYKLHVCHTCYKSLQTKGKNPPKFSVANGFDIGALPEPFQDARRIEIRLASLTSVAHSLVVLSGGRHRSLKGHVSVMRMNPTAIAKSLPRLLKEEDDEFRVIIAGTLTPMQEILGMRRFEARRALVEDLIHFYLKENCLYAEFGVAIDRDALHSLQRTEGKSVVPFERVGADIEQLKPSKCDGEAEESEETSRKELISSKTQSDVNAVEKKDTESSMSPGKIPDAVENGFVETASLYVSSTPQTSVEAMREARKTLLVRNRGDFVSDYDKKMFGLAFPELFPYGRRHPGTARAVKVSFEECCRYYLSLSNRSFAQHSSFTLVAFDVCGRQRVVKSTNIRSLCQPKDFEDFGNVTKEELVEALQEKRARREKALSGGSEEGLRARRTKADNLVNHVKVSQANMWGSAEERLIYRRQAFSMDTFLKTGAIFVTITPNGIGTLQVAAIAGRVCLENIRLLELGKLPDRAERAAIAGLDPVACAEHFELVCETFIEDVVGFDQTKGLPFKGGGVFGVVRAFLGVVEAQNSGNLHLHAILFIAGLPRTVLEFAEKCNNPINGEIFKRSICALVDSVVSATTPCSPPAAEEPQCPNCKAGTGLTRNSKVSIAAFKRQGRNQSPYPTSSCNECGKQFGACEVLRSEVRRLHTALDEISESEARGIPFGRNYRESDVLTELFCMKSNHEAWPPELESEESEVRMLHHLKLSRVVLLTQEHSYRHVKSCFKSSCFAKQGCCRYGFPKPAEEITRIDENRCMILKRGSHNEYIKGFNDVIALLFHSNHDIRFLLGGTTDALYYVMKYVTKSQGITSAVERAMASSYERRRKFEQEMISNGTPMSILRTGRARVNSMASALVKLQQVSAPMCALYLRRKTALYASHSFAKQLLGQCMAILREETYESALVARENGKFVRAPQILDYMCRSSDLESLSMMDFVSQYHRVKLPEKVKELTKQHDESINCARTGIFSFRKNIL